MRRIIQEIPNFIMIFYSVVIVSISFTLAKPSIKNCECWDGYKATYSANSLQCEGIDILHTMSCNKPRLPKCKCSGNVSGILWDKTGVWCTTYIAGTEIRRWHCENKKQWAWFFLKNLGYKVQR